MQPSASSTPQTSGKPILASLQAGRALAALLVMMYHNGLYIFALDKYWGYDPGHRLFNFAHAGVEFFFVLSGFIILHVHWQDLGLPSRFFSFAKKRFLRIYPMYWLVLALTIPIFFIVPTFGHPYHREAAVILSSVFLVHFDPQMRSDIAVAWTLYHEILFYAVFALAILNRRIGLWALAFWLIVSGATLALESPDFPLTYIASPLHLLFGMGMLACVILRNSRVKMPGLLALLGVGIFIATGLEEDYVELLSDNTRNFLFGAGSAMALTGLVELERQGRLRIAGWLRLMGDASYSIYLTHFMLLSLLAKIFIKLGAREMLPDLLCYALLPLLATLAGIAVHLYIERPLLRWLGRATKNWGVPPAPAAQFA